VGTALRRLAAITASATIVGAGAFVASPANAASTYSISGTVTLNGVKGTDIGIVACNSDCIHNGAQPAAINYSDNSGVYTLSDLPAGTYTLAVTYLDLEKGYDDDSGALLPGGGTAYLTLAKGDSKWTLTTTYGDATKETVSTGNKSVPLPIGGAIHNPKSQFSQTTPGTIDAQPCAGHTTTFKPTPFSDLPANGKVAYQWYAGATQDDMSAIKGATGVTFTPSAALVGKNLYVGMRATAPNRVAFDGIGPVGSVGNPGTCLPSPTKMPKKWIKSFGHVKGAVKHGKKVKVVGAKQKSKRTHLKISYTWMLAGHAVHQGKSYKLPKSAKHEKLTVKVSFSRAGYQTRSKTLKAGKVT